MGTEVEYFLRVGGLNNPDAWKILLQSVSQIFIRAKPAN
jgi:hypothetical protein